MLRTRSLLLGAAALALAAAPAFAADLTQEPAPMPMAPIAAAPTFNWTGFYAGVHGGGGWGTFNLDTAPNALGNVNGGFLGGQVGFRYQFDHMVVGIQTDIDWTNFNTSGSISPVSYINTKLTAFGTTTLRAGYAIDSWLPYVAGGLAYGQSNVELTTPIFAGSNSRWETGWTLGAGVEKAFTPHVTGFAEYDYIDLNNSNYAAGNLDFHTNNIKIGVNYKF